MTTLEPLGGMSRDDLVFLRTEALRSLSNPNVQPWDAFFDYHGTEMLIHLIDRKLRDGPKAL